MSERENNTTGNERRREMNIQKCDENNPAELYHRYPRQSEPQPTFLFLNPGAQVLGVDWDGEVGGAVPADVWHGRIRRYRIPCLTSARVNGLLEQVAPLAERVCAGYEEAWDGSNYIGRLDQDASGAEEEIARICDPDHWDHTDADGLVVVWEAGEYYYHSSDEEVGVTADASDLDLEQLAERLTEEALSEGVHVIEGLAEELEGRRDSLRKN